MIFHKQNKPRHMNKFVLGTAGLIVTVLSIWLMTITGSAFLRFIFAMISCIVPVAITIKLTR